MSVNQLRRPTYIDHICDVCRLLDGDSSPKPCAYCAGCRAWVCERDLGRWDRRARAAVMRRSGGAA